jgi:hypothetical protein
MTLDDLITIVEESDPADWNVLSGGGGDPSFLQRAVYRPNVAISLVWSEEPENDDFKEDWANKFPDPTAASYFLTLAYHGAPVSASSRSSSTAAARRCRCRSGGSTEPTRWRQVERRVGHAPRVPARQAH